MQTMKELIDTGFFPTDENGFALVPTVGDEARGLKGDVTIVTIVTTDAPGEYPIVGLAPGSKHPWAYDENGVIRPDMPNREDIGDKNMLTFSLAMPRVEDFTKFMTIDEDGLLIDVFDSREEAMASYIPDGCQMVEVDGQRYVRESLAQPSGFLFDDDSAFEIGGDEPFGEIKCSVARDEIPFGGFSRTLRILGL